jgi:hypothetical protein
MAKRSDTLQTVLMALELLRRIPRNRKISASELHEQLASLGLDRDLRTIQRQLEMLSEHFDIERDERNKPFGYRWKERAQGLAVPMLSEQESLLLTLAEQHLKSLLPANLMKSMESFFVQARTNLGPSGNSKREREWLSKVRVVSTTQPLWHRRSGREFSRKSAMLCTEIAGSRWITGTPPGNELQLT